MNQWQQLIVVLDEPEDNPQNWASLHQCLLMLFDSPLNHAGYLEVYIRLADGRVIKTHREIRIPRTFKRFEQLFNNFVQGCDMPVVQTKDGHTKLMQFVGKSIDKQFGGNYKRYRISNFAPRLRPASYFISSLETHRKSVVFIDFGPVDFNILGEGKETEYEIKTIDKYPNEDSYSISRYPLSPSLTCVKLLTSFEEALEVF